MLSLLLALALTAKPPRPPPSALATVRAAVEKAQPGCKSALQGRLAALEAAVQAAATTPARRGPALQQLTDVMGEADAACGDAVRLALAEVRQKLMGSDDHDDGLVPAPPQDANYRVVAINYLELANPSAESKACQAAAGPLLVKWLAHLRTEKPAKPLVKELRAKALALEKVCGEDVTERVAGAAVAISAAE